MAMGHCFSNHSRITFSRVVSRFSDSQSFIFGILVKTREMEIRMTRIIIIDLRLKELRLLQLLKAEIALTLPAALFMVKI